VLIRFEHYDQQRSSLQKQLGGQSKKQKQKAKAKHGFNSSLQPALLATFSLFHFLLGASVLRSFVPVNFG